MPLCPSCRSSSGLARVLARAVSLAAAGGGTGGAPAVPGRTWRCGRDGSGKRRVPGVEGGGRCRVQASGRGRQESREEEEGQYGPQERTVAVRTWFRLTARMVRTFVRVVGVEFERAFEMSWKSHGPARLSGTERLGAGCPTGPAGPRTGRAGDGRSGRNWSCARTTHPGRTSRARSRACHRRGSRCSGSTDRTRCPSRRGEGHDRGLAAGPGPGCAGGVGGRSRNR